MSEYPELDRMKGVQKASQQIGAFLEWTQSQGLSLCKIEDVGDPEEGENDEQYMPDRRGIEKMLADYFGIDLNKAEEEKRALLAEMVKLNNKPRGRK